MSSGCPLLKGALAALLLMLSQSVYAAVQVFACEPEWAALVEALAGERAVVYTATTARQDPHRIEARPSLIARMRGADLVVCTGAELEVGWLPVLLQEAGNARVRPGGPGYFEAARHAELLEIPAHLDRAQGDLHAAGNPHLHGDPRRLIPVARALAATLAAVDPEHAPEYRARLTEFLERWQQALTDWDARAAPLRGVPIVQQHRDPYLPDWLGVEVVAVLEPLPGVGPSAAHLARLAAQLKERPARLILRAAYQSARPADWLAARTGIPSVELPYTVGGSAAAVDLFALYEDTLARLLAALQ
ncbi:MAG: metal ABC transporter substrate-binding protein [Gammaproteobacteria bacterium]